MDDELRRVGIDEETELRLRQAADANGQSFAVLKRAILNALGPIARLRRDIFVETQRDFERLGLQTGFTDSMVRIDHLMRDFRGASDEARERARSRAIMCAVPIEQMVRRLTPAQAQLTQQWLRSRSRAARDHRAIRARPGGRARGILRRSA